MQLSAQLEGGAAVEGGAAAIGCQLPTAPDATLTALTGNARYQTNNLPTEDASALRQVALAHAGVLRSAFQCDLLRVATFQFCPGQNHVAFGGMWPSDPARIAMHHPVSHIGSLIAGAAAAEPPTSGEDLDVYQFLVNVQEWFNTLLAEILSDFKTAQDVFGNSVLDYTVVPYVTEVAQPNHARGPKPAFLFGGSALGLEHGTALDFQQDVRPQVDLYLTAAQALLGTSDVMEVLGQERFVQFNPAAAIIEGLWEAPA